MAGEKCLFPKGYGVRKMSKVRSVRSADRCSFTRLNFQRCHGFFLERPKNTANAMQTSATATISIRSIIGAPFFKSDTSEGVNNGPYGNRTYHRSGLFRLDDFYVEVILPFQAPRRLSLRRLSMADFPRFPDH
jgi:hypothetical protein